VKIDFWANSILVENGGSLIAGSQPGFSGGPFGTKRGVLTIHLYGDNQNNTNSGVGITCKSSSLPPPAPPCGIPSNIWVDNGNGQNKVEMPVPKGTTAYSDYFYQYGTLPFDDGIDTNNECPSRILLNHVNRL
jgi:hypothetical protein